MTRGAGGSPQSRRPKVRDDLVALEGYHSPQVDVDVRLNTNEAPWPPPDGFRQALADAVAGVAWHRYPDREATKLRAKLAAHHGVDPSMVFVANGSNEVLQLLCLAYGGAGRTVATFEPTYALHSHIARLAGTEVAVGERGPSFEIDLDEVRSVLDVAQPAITFLCSPNNPTGTIDPPEVLEATLALAPGLVVVDEAYGQFASRSALADVAPGRPLVVVRTFSKTWSMAAARLGYCVAPPEVVEVLEKVRTTTSGRSGATSLTAERGANWP